MDNLVAFIFAVIVTGFFMLSYLKKQKKIEQEALESAEKGKLRSDGPQSQHPHIDANYCIGCATCTLVCPEGDVLAMLGGKAVIVNGYKCIGHSLCAEVCPVGAITMVLASPSMGGDMAYLTPQYETITIDEGEIGGTVAKYPRQKLVMTSPVEFPMYGKFKKMQLSKEELIDFWHKVLERADFKVRQGEKVEDIKKGEDGIFTVMTPRGQYRTHSVVLALGKSGSPRKLGVKGEELPKVMYRLIEADHYVNKKILIVGGGDSAVEAAMGLGHQVGNKVTLSYRKEAFGRIKEGNTQRVQESIRKGKVKVVFNSIPAEFKENSVVLEVNGKQEEIPNDFVWIFAGGQPPTAFLKKIGIGFGNQDLTSTGSKEAKQAALAQA
ncbi:MAG: hypothetical protein DMG32_18705 [Acidobacteria bacterium]|nr:MAG: hypothetical protein DMG32_18705 [Acidobacteriota bacterium]